MPAPSASAGKATPSAIALLDTDTAASRPIWSQARNTMPYAWARNSGRLATISTTESRWRAPRIPAPIQEARGHGDRHRERTRKASAVPSSSPDR